MNLNEAIRHARKVAEEKYAEGMLFHANPNDDKLDSCIECAKEHEQLVDWLEELEQYRSIGTVEECREAVERQNNVGWIPCSSGQMPHVGSAVLIRLKNSNDGITGDDNATYDISFLRTSDNVWISSCGKYPFEDVIAWREIESYKPQ